MDMNLSRLAYSIFSFNLNKQNDKNVLSKAKDKDERSFLIKITPYIILLMVFILLVMGLWIMATHCAGLTGTEANTWQRMEGII